MRDIRKWIQGAAAVLIAGFLAHLAPGCGGQDTPSRPNLILVSIDTLRADHLGCLGYDRPTSPFLDALASAEGSVLFARCIAQAPNTAPSHMSLFTSLHPTVHGVPNVTSGSDALKMALPGPTRTLAGLLEDAGYRAAALTDGGYMDPMLGFGEGFEVYDVTHERLGRKVDRALEWLDENKDGDEPFFLFLHTYEVHAPYLPPPPFRDRFTGDYDGWIKDYCFGPEAKKIMAVDGFGDLFKRREEFSEADVTYLIGLYDGEIAYSDQELERFFDALKTQGLTDRTVIVILSDHGEEFGEHGEFSHKQLYDEVIRVPLLFHLPPSRLPVKRHRIEEQASLIDVMPTVLGLLKVEAPPHLQGEDLAGRWLEEAMGEERPAFSEFIDFGPEPPVCAVRFEGAKLLNYQRGKYLEIYDLAGDPGETENRFMQMARQGKQLYLRLDGWHKTNLELRKRHKAVPEGSDGMDPDLMKRLKQLGYGY